MQNISQYAGIIVLILLFVLMYFMMIRPQKKQQQKHQDTLKNLRKGDHVVTIGRLHGIVDQINNEKRTVTLDCDGLYLVFDLNAIASASRPGEEKASENDSKEKEVSKKNEPEKAADSKQTSNSDDNAK